MPTPTPRKTPLTRLRNLKLLAIRIKVMKTLRKYYLKKKRSRRCRRSFRLARSPPLRLPLQATPVQGQDTRIHPLRQQTARRTATRRIPLPPPVELLLLRFRQQGHHLQEFQVATRLMAKGESRRAALREIGLKRCTLIYLLSNRDLCGSQGQWSRTKRNLLNVEQPSTH